MHKGGQEQVVVLLRCDFRVFEEGVTCRDFCNKDAVLTVVVVFFKCPTFMRVRL